MSLETPQAGVATDPGAAPTDSGFGGATQVPKGLGGGATRPRQVAGSYPMRQVTWYQVSTSDLRSLGVAQAATTIFAAMGTFALSLYFDYSGNIALAQSSSQTPPAFLVQIANVTWWAWLGFWVLALGAFGWRRSEWARIRMEHGEPFWKWPWSK